MYQTTQPFALPKGFSLPLATTALQITTAAMAFAREVRLKVDKGFTGQMVIGFTSAITLSTTAGFSDSLTLTGNDSVSLGPDLMKADASNLWILASTTAGVPVIRGWVF